MLVTFDLPLSEKLSLEESLSLISRQGYQRLLVGGKAVRVEEAVACWPGRSPAVLTVVQDRLRCTGAERARLAEACEHAYHFGKGWLSVRSADAGVGDGQFSSRVHCAECDMDYREPSPALFSFNHPLGACPACKGFGRIITIDYAWRFRTGPRAPPEGGEAVADRARAECQHDLMRFCRRAEDSDWTCRLGSCRERSQDWVIQGDPDYGMDEEHEWPRAWYGVKGYFRWLESKAYKMHVRVLLSRYRAYQPCPECRGQRLQPEALLYQATGPGGGLFTLTRISTSCRCREALGFVEHLASRRAWPRTDPVAACSAGSPSRLGYLVEVGLGYLTLDRPTRSLSGGETERVNLTTCLGTRLVNTLFVLDEPSVGLHPRDTARLVRVLSSLRDMGNSVVVVEHEPSVMRAADQIIDLGPGHGERGGQVVFQGTFEEILGSRESLTGQYLSGARQIPVPVRRPVEVAGPAPRLCVRGARRHNLKDVTVVLPLQRFVCLTGVSGSGKTTLAREVLLPVLAQHFESAISGESRADPDEGLENEEEEESGVAPLAVLEGQDHLRGIVLVDQSPLGKTPRSNPGVYIGAFDEIRAVFAQTEVARQRGLTASAFSFNSSQGQCERCRGAGFEKIEMQFLSDVYVRCAECQGRRYRDHILEVKLEAVSARASPGVTAAGPGLSRQEWSVADVLDGTVDEVVELLHLCGESSAARRAVEALRLLQEVGLGYLRLGQPINTLSGGESQRLKLVKHLAQFARSSAGDVKPTLFIFDEPTTGLHFEDVRVLLQVFQRLVDAGHSLLVIEHNLEVIKCADWVVDLGPEAGAAGGQIVVAGTPEQVAACPGSHTGTALADLLCAVKKTCLRKASQGKEPGGRRRKRPAAGTG